ncbi:ABC transporter ATP-binding protein [Serratia fonticola]|uniref:ABC transporter ATP-binding protein n=1 Tax=Serratia fonticola TaxID=47917 RepID=UPI001AE12E0D|nr:dipeptide/oligopeptide/nickel ABC transporter ATP-binding protein [Serratia fonticola]MBP0997908.1 ABC transporter ATP-binding protein [Serratia fonticola]MBP1003829.1 ABC transporter ATP-binding protein [Serratia fonticola]MBP1013314.1 ABC transporter ATP-binding protein [Serratia fonticola]MBP1020070.1 ABC transporter ATP-binding protein [Serratia fonticola]CAI1237431.1 Glutathione import ATP-binding protein GsiA [Serratia fonticola]
MLLKVDRVSKAYPVSSGWRQPRQTVLDNVSFTLDKGESVGLVGPSGSGKSTLARIISGIERPDSGTVLLNGRSLYRRQHRRQQLSIVFQDYTTSVNPTMNVFAVLKEPLSLHGYLTQDVLRDRAAGLLEKVGLSPDLLNRYLHKLSGGQAQRVCIARALATQPALIILDEAVSSLDVPTQVQILDLLETLKREFQLSYFFITHDIQILCYCCQRVLFFNQHTIAAECPTAELSTIGHPYARALLSAVI